MIINPKVLIIKNEFKYKKKILIKGNLRTLKKGPR